jgi:hypothetical protein
MQKTQSARDTKGKKLGVTPAAAKANAATDTAEERDAIRADESAKASGATPVPYAQVLPEIEQPPIGAR